VPVFRYLVFGVLLLGGCATAPQIVWWRDDFSAEEFADDSALCLNYASARVESPAGARVDSGGKQELTRQLYAYCLTSLGYYQVELRDGRLPPPEAPEPETYDIRYRPAVPELPRAPRLVSRAAAL
jgi:hypothetical protein